MKIATDEVDAHGVGSDPDAMLALSARNDPEAFGLLYARYVHRVTSYFLLRTGIREDAEDLASQCFVRAFEALPRFRVGEGSVRSWLFAIAHNLSVSHYRAHRDTLPIDTVTLLDHAPPLEERAIRADDALNGRNPDEDEAELDGELGAAIAWLHEALKDGPLPSKQVFAEASENGIARSTLKRAKLQAGHPQPQGPGAGSAVALGAATGERRARGSGGTRPPNHGTLGPLSTLTRTISAKRAPLYIRSLLYRTRASAPRPTPYPSSHTETQEDQGTQEDSERKGRGRGCPLASALPSSPGAEVLTDPWDGDDPDWPVDSPSYDCATCLADEPEPAGTDDFACLEWPAPRGGVPEVIIVAPEVEDRRCEGCTRILAWGEARCRHCDKPPADPAGPVTIDASAWSRTDWAAWIGGGGNQCYHCGVPLRDDRRHCPTCRAALDLAGR